MHHSPERRRRAQNASADAGSAENATLNHLPGAEAIPFGSSASATIAEAGGNPFGNMDTEARRACSSVRKEAT